MPPCRALHDAFSLVSLPQDLVIKNSRLACAHRVLQLLFFAGLLAYVLQLQIWTDGGNPTPYGFSVWAEGDPNTNPNVRHCTNPGSLGYTYPGSTGVTHYMPTECRVLRGAGRFRKNVNNLLIYTHVIDTESFESSTMAECDSAAEAKCLVTNYTTFTPLTTQCHCNGVPTECSAESQALCTGASVNFTSNATSCRCQRRSEYFAQNPEDMTVHFVHGYEANFLFGSGSEVVTTSVSSRKMVTVFRRPDGSPCEVNGRTEIWNKDVGPQGIFGSLRQLLACAGHTLDDGPAQYGRPNDVSVTYLRLMGLTLELNMVYTNVDPKYRPDVACHVVPRVHATWTSAYGQQQINLGLPFDSTLATRNREAYGVAVSFQVTGQLKYFSMSAFVNGLVNVLFLLSIPNVIIGLVAEYCLGRTSRIYQHAKRTYFSIRDQMRVAIARSVLPLMAFRGMVGGDYDKRAADLPAIEKQHLMEHLQDVFADQLRRGDLEEKHLIRMVDLVCEVGEKPNSFTYKDFEAVCNSNDVISGDILVHLLHGNVEMTRLERLMNSASMFGPDISRSATWATEGDTRVDDLLGDSLPRAGPKHSPSRSPQGGGSSRQSPSSPKPSGRRDIEAQVASPAARSRHSTEDEEALMNVSVMERLKNAELAAQQALKGMELALARARTAEDRAGLAEALARASQQAGSQEVMLPRIQAAEELAVLAREEAQQAVFSAEAMRAEMNHKLDAKNLSTQEDVEAGKKTDEDVVRFLATDD